MMSVERRATVRWDGVRAGRIAARKDAKDWGRGGDSNSLVEWHCTQPRANDRIRGVDGDDDVGVAPIPRVVVEMTWGEAV